MSEYENKLTQLANRLEHLDGHDGEERDEIEMIAAELRQLAKAYAVCAYDDQKALR